MNTFARLSVCALMPLLISCQTEKAQGFPKSITGIDRTIYVDATCASDRAILISHGDMLSLGTAEQIGDHNNDLWCKCEHLRPQGFNASICKV